jgi:hypothetical protein
MTVIVTLRMKGDPKRLEEIAAQDADRISGISSRGKERGVIAHRFYGSDDGQIMVIDEWPDAESFQGFFEAAAPAIGPLMQEAGIEGAPEVTFWRKLETRDEIGWEG